MARPAVPRGIRKAYSRSQDQSGGNSNKRVAVDRDTGEYVVFQQESDGRYHGYATDDWFSLRQSERNAFIDSGLVSPTGRIK